MKSFTEVLAEFSLQRVDLSAWIEQEWVKPARQGDDWVFDDADLARVGLICELREDMAVGDETLPMVLSLLDQLYATRAVLARLTAAIADLPEPHRSVLLALVRDEEDGE